MVPSGSGWKIAAVFALGRCRGRRTSRQDRRSTHVNDASVPRCRGLLQPAPPPVCSWLSTASLILYVYQVQRYVFVASPVFVPLFFIFVVGWFFKKRKPGTRANNIVCCCLLYFYYLIFVLFRVSFSAKVYAPGPHGACWLHCINEAAYYLK